MKDACVQLLDMVAALRPDYGDVRLVHRFNQRVRVHNAEVEMFNCSETMGYGVRVLKNGRWGFAASNEFTTDRMKQAVDRAFLNAGAALLLGGDLPPFEPPPPVVGDYETVFTIDPFRVSASEKLAFLVRCTEVMLGAKAVAHARASMECSTETKFFFSTTGSRIRQRVLECGGGIAATAVGTDDVQTRSYPSSFGGNFATAGYEFIDRLDLGGHSERIAAEAAELLQAPVCPTGVTDVILESSQLALQIHESIGHPLELDRILGYEASFAGTSFVQPEMIGRFRYGSPVVNVVANPTVPLGLGTFGYDDEGVAARPQALIEAGLLTGVLACCSTARSVGQKPTGCMRADGWANFPIVRMNNINLQPGEWDFDALVGDTHKGLLLETNRSWSIDDKRLNFQFGTEIAREIRNGKIGRLYRNPVYTGITPRFWGSCDAVCGGRDWRLWGVPNCGKGEPMQVARVGHGCAPARFRKVEVRGG